MTFSELTDLPHSDLGRGDLVVCVCDTGDRGSLESTLAALRAHLGAARRLLIAGAHATPATAADLDDVLVATMPADVAVVPAGFVVAEGWLERMRTAAQGDERIAAVSAAPVRTGCVLIRRTGFELAGPLDGSGTLDTALVDFVERCEARGLRHLVADDEVEDGRPMSVTIDGRCLSVSSTGTAVSTLDLVDALGRHSDLHVRVVVLDDLGQAIRERLTRLGAELLLAADAATAEPTDIAHRPYQVGAPEDLMLLSGLGRRLIVTQLDCIAYRTPAYFDSIRAWHAYRTLTAAALAAADEVVFLSAHGAADARMLGLVDERRSTVIPLVAAAEMSSQQPAEPAGELRPPLPDRPYLLCLGTDFAHKNRAFALRLLESLVTAGSFDGLLVFAGPHVTSGGSAGDEAAYLKTRPQIAERVIDLGVVDDPHKRRLLANAVAVVYPTVSEGFGLIPFEAARLGVPALFAWVTSLRDLFAEDLALLVPWDAEASARAVAPVLLAGEPRDRQIERVLAAGASLTAAELSRRHAQLYRRALARPRDDDGRIGLATAHLMIELEAVRGELRNAQHELDGIYGDPIASGFVGPHAIVPEELQRATLAVATRPALRDRVVGLYHAARRLARLR